LEAANGSAAYVVEYIWFVDYLQVPDSEGVLVGAPISTATGEK
jgi:hypothetical protein